MTEKELHKLRRQDLLQLLLSQSKEVAQLRKDLEATEETARQLRESNDRLKDKLNAKDEQLERLKEKLTEKDAQIEKLKGRLDEKDQQIETLQSGSRLILNADGTAGIRLADIFDAAQSAAETYVRDILASDGEEKPRKSSLWFQGGKDKAER